MKLIKEHTNQQSDQLEPITCLIVGSMMEPAVLQEQPQQQLNDYKHKVNEMQKLLPSLERYITNVANQNENAEELKKLKLLQQLLRQQEVVGVNVVGDSLTLAELDKYEIMLKDADRMTLWTSTSALASIACDGNKISHVSANVAPLEATVKLHNNRETVKKLYSSTNYNEEENKNSERVENGPTLSNECEKMKEANGSEAKKSEHLEKESKSSDNESESLYSRDATKELTSSSEENKEQKEQREPQLNVARSKQFDEISEICEKEEEDANSNGPARKLELKVKNAEKNQQKNKRSTDTVAEVFNHFETQVDIEEIEYEDVELIKIPESTAEDEMILPDSADEAEFAEHKSDDEGEDAEEEEGTVEEEEEQVGEDKVEEENIDSGGSNDNAFEKAENIEKDQGLDKTAVGDESGNTQENMEGTEGSESNHRDTENAKDVNEKINEDTDDDEAHMEEAIIEENSETLSGSNEESNTLPAEFDVEIDSQNEAAVEAGDMLQTDDPLGPVETINDEDNSQATSSETAVIRNTENQISQQPADVTAKTVSTEHPNVEDDDDDDVEIIESRNSPICLDTDDENEKEIEQKYPDEYSLLREAKSVQSLRKRQHIRVPSRNEEREMIIATAKSVTETIELLDSSDEDGASSTSKLQKGRRKSRKTLRPTLTRTLVKMPNQQMRMGKKRTLLPAAQAQKPIKISKVMSGGAVPEAYRAFLSETSSPPPTIGVKSPRSVLLFPPTNFTPTPQSNFLNAVNLLPASATTGDNPLAFSATLSNKNIIIPNAFYANRRTTAKDKEIEEKEKERVKEPAAFEFSSKSVAKSTQVPVTHQQERVYREWLDEFIENFTNPQQIASHSCLVLMQGALKYKVFARIKDLRTSLNTKAYTSNCTTDGQLTRELRNVFYTDACRLSLEGLRFCAGACTQIGSNVTLMTDARTGRITTRTSSYDELLARYVNSGGASSDDKRKRHKGDEEYTPAKYYEKKVEESSASQGERRKSLRQHRSRCYDETFLYEPEEADDDEPPSAAKEAAANKRRQEEQMMALVQRKAEEKRLEAKRQRQQQVKSFESAYLEMFANSLQAKNLKGSTAAAKTINESSSKSRSSNSTDSANNQIVIDDDDEDSLVDGEPRSHRIYKVVPTRLLAAENTDSSSEDEPRLKRGRPRKQDLRNLKTHTKAAEPELITCDSTSDDSINAENNMPAPNVKVPKNVNPNWHAGTGDFCIICKKRVSRIVSHYVNDHPACEVYNSRIPKATLAHLRKQGGQKCEKRQSYKYGQDQYAAICVFCNKDCCFKINYWYQHYAIHTGEYAFRCSGCGARKTTTATMRSHINQSCRRRGKLIQDYTYDTQATEIKMDICTLCNYMQLHRSNVLKHLRTQHGLKQIQAKHIESIVVLRTIETEEEISTQDAKEFLNINSGGDENSSQMAMTFNYDNFDEAGAVDMWDDGDPTDDLSYMICGMLDVQMGNNAD